MIFTYMDYCGLSINDYDPARVATAVDEQTRGERLPLIEGRRMRCPRCKTLHDILTYVPMQQIEEFAAETNPIYKCPSCRWIFSPAPHVLEEFV